MAGLGDEFRAAREARHLSLSDVSEQIHIRSVYLQSLEDEDWKAIAAPVYVRGFIRTYARFLGLDPEHAVGRFNATLGDGHKGSDPVLAAPARRRRPSFALWAAVVIAVLLVGFVGYSYFEFQETDRSSAVSVVDSASAPASEASNPAPDTAAPIAEAPAAAAPAPGATETAAALPPGTKRSNGKLEVHLTESSWLLVKVDGNKMLEGTFPAGTTRDFAGARDVTIRTGNAGGVDLRLNGKELGLMGNPGAVVDRTIPLAEE
jgi:cytoskeletal protein RodZ